jgi:hypothetical protein
MLGTIALTALNLLDDIKPKPESRVERYITDRVPMLEVVPDDAQDWTPPIPKNPRVVKSRKPRKKHVCYWTDRDVWGACTFVFLVGVIVGICI